MKAEAVCKYRVNVGQFPETKNWLKNFELTVLVRLSNASPGCVILILGEFLTILTKIYLF